MQNTFKMIDVGNKTVTYRLAVASGEIFVKPEAFDLIKNKKLPKGDVLVLSEIAGITGAKKAYEMIPLCHPMGLDAVKIITELDEQAHSVKVYCFASTHAKTGVEMEALAGVNSALLTIWDLSKMIEPDLRISNIKLLAKLGGKKGLWINGDGIPDWIEKTIKPEVPQVLENRNALVITLSDRASKGEYEDKSGAILKEILINHGAKIAGYAVIADDEREIKENIQNSIKAFSPDLIICTGGTGVSERDVTPEAVRKLFDKEIPGVGELLRFDGAKYTPLSWSSRAIAGVIGKTLVITLPGNPNAVNEGMSALLPHLIPHLIRIIKGEKL
ncbi:MAG TPA: bifunctional molybdenum cofactor biosynthesis protein MoaC/MoaB [Alphaproteobacteria bacterium]|nr:bifunctional molybdenum cofactor biosynthesis protein MoaC/MoaB [Alphaproteobacteria bacterium]